MNADYYDDAETTATAPPEEAAEAPETEQPEEEGQEEQDQEETPGRRATLPKEFFGPEPPQPGDTCELKVLGVHDQEVEVEYREKETDEEEAEPEESEPTPAVPPDANYE